MPAITFNSTVNIIISAENVQTVVSFLISNHISFTLTNSTYQEKHNIVIPQVKEKSIDNSTPAELLSPKSLTMEAIYQKYLVQEITQIPPTETQIAAEIGIPLVKFKNEFKITYGKPFYQLYMEKRMEYAAQLLQKGYRANKVSAMVGYGEKSSIKFNKMFQKHFGMTPKKYQTSQK
jgi:AraC-like DNA-binding protein